MYQSIKQDERFCLICNKTLNEKADISDYWKNSSICHDCRNQFIIHRMVYHFDIDWYVLYEYNEFLERLLFRYKEQKDVVLSPVFFESYIEKIKELSHRYCICVMCSSENKRMERAFEPMLSMLECFGVEVYSPLYKIKNLKQSEQSLQERKEISCVIQRKELYPLPNKPILLIDDVCTTSYTIQRGIELLKPKMVILLCANPKWIQSMQVVKKRKF